MTSPVKTVYLATQMMPDVLKKLLEKRLPNVLFNIVQLDNAKPGKGAVGGVFELTSNDFDKLKDAEILITDNNLLTQLAFALPRLRWLQGSFAGVNLPMAQLAGDLSAGRYPPFVATRFTGESYGQLMFEYCLSFIISKERGFREHQILQPSKDWQEMKARTPETARLLNELKITILGTGAIGTVLSKSFKKLGCAVIGYSRTDKSAEHVKEAGLSSFSTNLDDVLVDTDYVISILPHTPETIGLLNGRFSVCKSQPVFINLGRGSVMQESNLIEALDAGHLSQAVLDVYEKEPLPVESSLWLHPKVVMTPHMAAETRPQDLAEVFVQNYERFTNGQNLLFPINWKAGY